MDKKGRIMMIYFQEGNKRGIFQMEAIVEEHHYCLRCPYNPRNCIEQCERFEEIKEIQGKIKEEFEDLWKNSITPCITPLKIERLRGKMKRKRTISEILETQKKCKPGEMAEEIATLSYKMRNGIRLEKHEEELRDAYFKGRS